ncbi:MAG TPA: TonB-dependent receptor [Bryobacteraceae bacterium]
MKNFAASAKGADARRQTTKELADSSGGAPSAQPVGGVVRDSIRAAPVLRVFLKIFLISLAALLAPPGVALAQIAGSGTIQGTLTDASGAAVPQATVTATNVATGVAIVRQPTAAGLYVLSPLPAGDYNIKITAPGFQTINQQHVVVEELQTVGLDFQLKVGSASEEVTVSASATMLRTDDVALGSSMQNTTYNALPLAMAGVPRDPTQFIALAPGVAAVVTQAAGPSYTSFNGGQQETAELYLEGVPMTYPNQQGDTRNLALGVSVEAIEQFQVETTGQKAMYQGQGMHNYVLKSGTNQFHGAVYEYFRNTSLDARGFFSPIVPVDHQNEFGANLGGRIIKDKLFFFSNYSGYYYNTATAPTFITIPTAAQRIGNFSALTTPIYDPASASCSGSVCTKAQFSGNIIPTNRISPVSNSFQSYLPATTNGNITNNYLSSLPKKLHNNNTTNKVDWNQSQKNRISGLYAHSKYLTDYTGNLAPNGTALPLPYNTSAGIVEELPTIAQIHQTFVFTPALVNDASFGLARIWIPLFSTTADGNYIGKAGLTGMPPGNASLAFPAINFAGPNAPNTWGTTGPFNEAENNFTFADNLAWVRGRHSLTFGFQIQRLQDNRTPADTGSNASFSFSNNETAGFLPNSSTLATTTGNAFASYLLGAVDSASVAQNSVVVYGARYHDWSAFVQDDWSVNSRLTMNIGLRYDFFGPSFEVADRMSFLNPDIPNPAAGGRPGALQFAGNGPASCNCQYPYNAHYKNFEPRFGLAYKLDSKTVLRTGFTLNYTHGAAGIGGNGANAGPSQLGYNANATFTSPATGQPAFYWANGLPPYQHTPFIDPGYGVGFTTTNPTGAISIPYASPDLAARPPYYMNWSFGVQRELTGNMTVGATYAASVGHFLANAADFGIWTNSIYPSCLVLGSLLNLQATSTNLAAASRIVPGIALPFSNFQGTIAQALKPFPQYSGVTYYSGDLGNSTYNSLQLTFDRRFSGGLTGQAGYTFSREIDDVIGVGSHLGAVGGNRDPFNGHLDKSLGTLDHRHIFHATFVYDLPFGTGRRFSGGNAVVRTLVSGWQLSGIVTFTSGAPLGITGSGCVTPGIVSTCMASYAPNFSGPVRINGDYGNGNALAPGAVSYIDKKAFADPAPYTFGNTPRAAPYGLFAPSLLGEDISIRRQISITERVKIALSGDFFNITNSVYFAAPGTNIDSSTFGQVTTTANLPRKLQINARLTF